MIAVITPSPVEAHTSRTRIWMSIGAYNLGLVMSTTGVGAAVGILGAIVQVTVVSNVGYSPWWIATVGGIALFYGFHELRIVRLPMPQVRWQVPVSWDRYGKIGQSLLYGIVLGSEIFTFVPYASIYILVLLEATLGVKSGMILGIVYGLARAVPTILGIVIGNHQRDTVPVAVWIVNAENRFHVANGIVLAVVGEVLIGLLFLSV